MKQVLKLKEGQCAKSCGSTPKNMKQPLMKFNRHYIVIVRQIVNQDPQVNGAILR